MAAVERRHGIITDESVRALRSRIGIPVKRQDLPFFEEVTEDNIRNFAHATGDINPLYTEPGYARGTRWGGMIAPGCILFSMGIGEGREITKEEREEGRGGGMPGVHGMWSGVDFEWYLPMNPADTVYRVSYLADVQEKQGQFAGRQVLSFTESLYRNQRREVVAKEVSYGMRTERDTARDAGKYNIEPYVWSDREIEEIDAAYERERYRGAEPRYWEDVSAGDEITPMVRGPFTGTDAIAWKMGWGFGPFVRTGKDGYVYRQRHPMAYVRNSLNIPDVVERVHWESEFAREVGVPGYYDYGPQRASWMGNLLTNWIGDDGWVKKMSVQARRFNVEGDAQWYKGRVTEKYVKDGEYTVECELWAENQRGEITAPGTAVVLLPSRAGGPVKLPAQGQPPYPTWNGPSGKVVPAMARR
jgi:acyl dehydratase